MERQVTDSIGCALIFHLNKTMANREAPIRSFREEAVAYMERMRALAAIASLAPQRNSDHPLFRSLVSLNDLMQARTNSAGELNVGGFGPGPEKTVDQLFELLHAQSTYGYDRMYWLADGYFEELEQDVQARKFIAERLPVAEHYEATIAELGYWGWIKARGGEPALLNSEGMPDLLLGPDVEGDSVYCDVKLIQHGTASGRVRKVIEKANRQLKRVHGENTKGLCYIRILAPVIRYPRFSDNGHGRLLAQPDEGNRNALGVPNEIAAYFDAARNALSGPSYRTVSKTILSWEERLVIGNIPGWLTVMGTRNSCLIEHHHARVRFNVNYDLLPKATVAFNIRVVPRVPYERGMAWQYGC
ncbi:MAG: hypothetical protein E6Q34_06570 [Burkholderiaceae bacterium]|nr:MAG: hypothetical protein E6Q34_06570 [Burkholderiaceae bacterium]